MEDVKRMLLVEDELDLAELLQIQLAQRGFFCRSARSGREALEIMEQEDFDVICSDILLPDMGILDLTSQMKETCAKRGVSSKVLLVTGQGSDEIESTIKKQFQIIYKPFDLSDLESAIVALFKCDAS